jgi:hypothetical protein
MLLINLIGVFSCGYLAVTTQESQQVMWMILTAFNSYCAIKNTIRMCNEQD